MASITSLPEEILLTIIHQAQEPDSQFSRIDKLLILASVSRKWHVNAFEAYRNFGNHKDLGIDRSMSRRVWGAHVLDVGGFYKEGEQLYCAGVYSHHASEIASKIGRSDALRLFGDMKLIQA